jgi:hypothetical protein
MESGLGLEKQNLDSGRGRTFFLTSLLIELIELKKGEQTAQAGVMPSVYNNCNAICLQQ